MTLFQDFIRTYNVRTNHDSSAYDFLNKSTWSAATYIRDKIAEWSADFPLDNDFVQRFTSNNNQEHSGAFFEIVIHRWLKCHSFEVEVHKIASQDSDRRPDFLVSDNNTKIFFAECTLSALPYNDLSIEKLKNQITDLIENISCPKYFVNIDFVECSKVSIPKSSIISFVNKVIAEGDQIIDLDFSKKWTMQERGWKLDFSLFLKSVRVKRTLGAVGNGPAQFINSERTLRTALDRKRGRNYGTVELPYVICINSSDFYLDDLSIMQTLFGSFSSDSKFTSDLKSDGFFINKGSAQNKSVSAVLIVNNVVPWNLHVVKASLWHNPFSKHPLDLKVLKIDQNTFNLKNGIGYERHRISNCSFADLLSIDMEYMNRNIE